MYPSAPKLSPRLPTNHSSSLRQQSPPPLSSGSHASCPRDSTIIREHRGRRRGCQHWSWDAATMLEQPEPSLTPRVAEIIKFEPVPAASTSLYLVYPTTRVHDNFYRQATTFLPRLSSDRALCFDARILLRTIAGGSFQSFLSLLGSGSREQDQAPCQDAREELIRKLLGRSAGWAATLSLASLPIGLPAVRSTRLIEI